MKKRFFVMLLAGVVTLTGLLSVIWITASGVVTSSEQIKGSWHEYVENPNAKARLLAKITRSQGYNGFIHSFKNYIIRQDEAYAREALGYSQQLLAFLKMYEGFPLSPEERKAVADIRDTFTHYTEMVQIVENMMASGASIQEIDEAVRIDDRPARRAFDQLEKAWWLSNQEGEARLLHSAKDASDNSADIMVMAIICGISIVLLAGFGFYQYVQIRLLSLRIAEDEANFRGIIENTSDGVVVISEEGAIELFNQAAVDCFGYDQVEIVGRDISALVPEERRGTHRDYIKNATKHEPEMLDRPRDLVAQRKDGSHFPIELSIDVFHIDQKKKYIGVFRDVTQRKAAEMALIRAKLDAEAANQSKIRFVANISHELRTPLNAVIGFSDLMKAELYGAIGHEKYKEYLHDIANSGQHLLAMINDILDISKLEEGRFDLHTEVTSLPHILETSLKTLKPLASKRHISLERKCIEPNIEDIECDPRRLHQVLLNIIGNAIKFTPEHGRVEIRLESKQGESVQIMVSDTGPGVPADKIQSILRPFERMESHTKADIEGSGLGLPIAKYLVELHEGSLVFASEEGVGSVVTITLPLRLRENKG